MRVRELPCPRIIQGLNRTMLSRSNVFKLADDRDRTKWLRSRQHKPI